MEQVLCSLQLRRLKLFHSLQVDQPQAAHNPSSCCNSAITDDEVFVLDDVVSAFQGHSEQEDATIYYICGYVAKKTGLVIDINPQFTDESCEFTTLVSRGLLSHPPESLFQFARVAYSVFCRLQKTDFFQKCTKRIVKLLLLLYEVLPIVIERFEDVCVRLSNIFMRGFVNFSADASLPNTRTPFLISRKRQHIK